MPLAIGNKWYFGSSLDSIALVKEVVSLDRIEGKAYFRTKVSYELKGNPGEVFEYYRLNNDTLFTCHYNETFGGYKHWPIAIFSLDVGDLFPTFQYKALNETKWTTIRSAKVTQKENEIIEFLETMSWESGSYTAYKKGVGIIEMRSLKGRGINLVDYELKHLE